MANQELIAILNDLIQTSRDSEEGFIACAEDGGNPRFRQLLLDRAQNCNLAARELQALVRAYGGDPQTHGSFGGALHRRWIDARAALLGNDDEAILKECERGVNIALANYTAALKTDLRPEARSVVERQYQGVLRSHDLVKTMREQVQVRSPWLLPVR